MKWPTLSEDTRWLLWRTAKLLIVTVAAVAVFEDDGWKVTAIIWWIVASIYLDRQPIHITVVVPAPDEWDDDGGTQLPLPKLPQRFTFHQNETRH